MYVDCLRAPELVILGNIRVFAYVDIFTSTIMYIVIDFLFIHYDI